MLRVCVKCGNVVAQGTVHRDGARGELGAACWGPFRLVPGGGILAAALAIDEQDVLHAILRKIRRSTGCHRVHVKTIADVPLRRLQRDRSVALRYYDNLTVGANGGVRVLVLVGDGECLVRVTDDTWTVHGAITWKAVLNDPARSINDLARRVHAEWERHP